MTRRGRTAGAEVQLPGEGASCAPTTSSEVRAELERALQLDLVGPEPGGEHAEECLLGWERPSRWYLTGFLVPADSARDREPEPGEDDFDAEVVKDGREGGAQSSAQRKRSFFPSSLGLSFVIAPEARELGIRVIWGEYRLDVYRSEEGKEREVWRRTPRSEAVSLALSEAAGGEPVVLPVPQSEGLELQVIVRAVDTERLQDRIPAGSRTVSAFLVNRRKPNPDEKEADTAYAFQAGLAVTCDAPFPGRPDLTAGSADSWDGQVAALHYADAPSFATGHGVSADWTLEEAPKGGVVCREVRTAWIGRAEVEATRPREGVRAELRMKDLGKLVSGEAARKALLPLVAEYREWIDEQEASVPTVSEAHRGTATGLLHHARLAASRMESGVEVLARDELALDAFRVANRSVGEALSRRIDEPDPAWRPFQLAFLLLNLAGMADPTDPDRRTVDLLFFPTGGGKTEAYLGLAAFAIVLRRLRHPEQGGRCGAGVSVLMRYTLRLLTLDQLARAAGLVCALELEREENPARYGEWPFEIGLWVGMAATPNRLGKVGDTAPGTAYPKLNAYKADPQNKPAPIPLERCPWCRHDLTPDSFSMFPNPKSPRDLRIRCLNLACDFSALSGRWLPVVAVDEPLYRRLPAFLIATVDKFASLPWEGRSGLLLGGAERYDDHGFYGPATPHSGRNPLHRPLSPPDLVIQDELHLITGPLGTMMGLYEAAIGGLAEAVGPGPAIGPKIIASTATARAARDQVQAVFAREDSRVFPPSGLSRRDTFLASTAPASEVAARRYLGIAAPGRSAKKVMSRVLLAVMSAVEKQFRDAGGRAERENPADPYMTTLAYFSSLRELGGARRIVEEEVQNTLKNRGLRRRVGECSRLFRDRYLNSSVLELTSRVATNEVAEAFDRLAIDFHQPSGDGSERGGARPVEVALATNMISVGLDVARLGLMVVLGQPKTHAEYIQATSRVGRDAERPGLVLTLLNVHKARDRSHYERFRHYHETFYRSVEPVSVTPFAARALDRGFSGALVSLARHLDPELTPPSGASAVPRVRQALEDRLVEAFVARLEAQPNDDEALREQSLEALRRRIVDHLDSWRHVVKMNQTAGGGSLCYQKHENVAGQTKGAEPLLRYLLERGFRSEHHRKFRANRSLRDVEPEVPVFIRDAGK